MLDAKARKEVQDMDTPFDRRELESFRQRLMERKRDIWHDLSERLRDEAEDYQAQLGRALDDPEKALVDLLGDTDMLLLENRRDELVAIEEALGRIDEGTYGLCSDCGERIAARRLEAMPFAVRCVEDQERREARLERAGL
jgi:DnaK suppressor protein